MKDQFKQFLSFLALVVLIVLVAGIWHIYTLERFHTQTGERVCWGNICF